MPPLRQFSQNRRLCSIAFLLFRGANSCAKQRRGLSVSNNCRLFGGVLRPATCCCSAEINVGVCQRDCNASATAGKDAEDTLLSAAPSSGASEHEVNTFEDALYVTLAKLRDMDDDFRDINSTSEIT